MAILYVSRAYCHAEIPEEKLFIMKLKRQFVGIICSVKPEHKKYVRYESEKMVLYLKVLSKIYGWIEWALLWYNMYALTLKGLGLK